MLEIIYWNLMYFMLVMFAVMIFGEILENRKRRKVIKKNYIINQVQDGDNFLAIGLTELRSKENE